MYLKRNLADSTTHGIVKKLAALLKNTDTLQLLDFKYRLTEHACVPAHSSVTECYYIGQR